MVKFETKNNLPNLTTAAAATAAAGVVIREEWKWQVMYARCFTVPPGSSSSTASSSSVLIRFKRNLFKPIWISSSGLSTVSLHPPADGLSSADSIITVSLQGTVVEEHLISNLIFTWPQVSCVSGFPARGSLAVIASYKDSADEKQKFGLRFSTLSETEDFINSLQDILADKLWNNLPSVEAVSAVSSQSDFVPPYRPDTSHIRSPTYTSPTTIHLNDIPEEPQGIDKGAADIKGYIPEVPPRFTSLVSNCSAEAENGNNLALPLPVPEDSEEFEIKSQIAKYMQDASFIDMVDKVNNVIRGLGGDYGL